MIVDVHYHMMHTIPEEMVDYYIKILIHAARMMGREVDQDAIARKVTETFADPTGDNLLALMEESGVDFTCICTVDSVHRMTADIAKERNRWLASIANKHPDKLAAFAGVDPRRPMAPDMLKQCFEEFGMKGLKYHPDHGYDPGGPESYRLLSILERHEGILLSHTGPLGPPARCKYSEPIMLADIAVDFPTLKVIAAHMGQINWRSWASLAAYQPNLYGDLAMWDAYAFGHYELFCRELRDVIDYTGPSRVLFGTDNPIFNTVVPTKEWIQLIKDLPVRAPEGIKFTEAEANAILGGNAASLLGLKQKT